MCYVARIPGFQNFKFFKRLFIFLVFRYGELQGLNKQETADKYGKEQVHEWRRSFDIPPPNGESLEMCAERAVAYFKEHVKRLYNFISYFVFFKIKSFIVTSYKKKKHYTFTSFVV